jgi:hypothetical protein
LASPSQGPSTVAALSAKSAAAASATLSIGAGVGSAVTRRTSAKKKRNRSSFSFCAGAAGQNKAIRVAGILARAYTGLSFDYAPASTAEPLAVSVMAEPRQAKQRSKSAILGLMALKCFAREQRANGGPTSSLNGG